jgi:hypothetical protein
MLRVVKMTKPPLDLTLQLRLATVVSELIEEIGYEGTLNLLRRECHLLSVGKRATELTSTIASAASGKED